MKDAKKGNSGQTTIFSAIIMAGMLALACLLIDAARIAAGRAMVKRTAGLAARSILAEYKSKLKENYGLFAFTVRDETELRDSFKDYLASGLSMSRDEDIYEGSVDLFGFRIEKVSLTPIYNLSENEVAKKQILEHMKYRAPAEMVEKFLEKLSSVKDLGKMSDAYKRKVKIDKIFGSMDKLQQKLKKCVDGIGGEAEKFINGFNQDGRWESAFRDFNSLMLQMDSLKKSIESASMAIGELESEKCELEKQLDETGGEKDASGAGSGTECLDDVENRLEELKNEKTMLESAYAKADRQLSQAWNELRHAQTGDYIAANENAAEIIERLVEKGMTAHDAISELEKYLDANFSGYTGGIAADFREQALAELNKFKELALHGQKAEEILEMIKQNRSVLQKMAAIMDCVRNAGGGAGTCMPPELLEMAGTYSSVNYDYSRPAKETGKSGRDDPRKGKAEAVGKFLSEKILEDKNYETAGIDKNTLPSFSKKITDGFDKEDSPFLGDNESGRSGADGGQSNGAVYMGRFEKIDEEMDLFNEDGMFQENALDFIAGVGRIAGGKISDLRNNIYINEYIMKYFKNSVPVKAETGAPESGEKMQGSNDAGSDTFYDSEVEYILQGNPSQALNNAITRGEILLARFGFNTLHVYTDPEKRLLASGIATAVAGWWTGGAGIPIISNLIMCAWAMGESLIDLEDLLDGKPVPVYKLKGDWKLDIGLAAQFGPRTDSRLYFDYHDYLRLFLLATDENKKLDRIEDLVQLNIGKSEGDFRMSGSYTFIRVEVEVSMKYLFITRPFIKRELNTKDGRYLFKVLLYEGY